MFAPGLELSSEYQKDDPFFSFFELHSQKVYVNKLDALSSQSRNVYPIAIELSASSIKKMFGEINTLEYIKISWIKRLVFQNEGELRRFKFGAFDDVDLQKLELLLEVDDSVFASALNFPSIEGPFDCEINNDVTRKIDSQIAFNWSLLTYPNVDIDWINFLQNHHALGLVDELEGDYKAIQCINEGLKNKTTNQF